MDEKRQRELHGYLIAPAGDGWRVHRPGQALRIMEVFLDNDKWSSQYSWNNGDDLPVRYKSEEEAIQGAVESDIRLLYAHEPRLVEEQRTVGGDRSLIIETICVAVCPTHNAGEFRRFHVKRVTEQDLSRERKIGEGLETNQQVRIESGATPCDGVLCPPRFSIDECIVLRQMFEMAK